MGLFDVYVEGATDPSPAALQRLAEVMSQRYGLPAGELQNRLAKGRFRVKANVDDATAQTYVHDLEAVGARVVLTEARGGSTMPPPTRPKPESRPPPHPITVSPRQRNESRGSYSISRNSSAGIPLPDDELLPQKSPTTPPPITPRTLSNHSVAAPPQRTSSPSLPPQTSALPPRTTSPSLPPQTSPLPPRSSSPSLPPQTSPLPPRTSSPSLPPQTSPLPPRTAGPSNPPSNTPFASGLSAAFGESGPVDATAFDSLSIGSLDDNAPQVETSPVLPASIGPAAIKPALPKVDKPKDVPMDLFAPPESQGDEFKVELAAEEVAHRERKRTPAAVPIAVPPSPSTPVLRPKVPPSERSAGVRMPSMSDDAPRGRFAVGVLVSVVLGFIPATMVHSCREDAAFDKIDNTVVAVQQQAATSTAAPIPFAKLDDYRDEQLAKKQSERRNIAIVSMLIWALVGAGIGYVWFRRVPWDKIKFS